MRKTFLIVLIAFMVVGGCGSSGDGGVSCEDVVDVFCERVLICEPSITFEECVLFLAQDCDNVEDTFSQECLVDIAELDCSDVLLPLIPEACREDVERSGLCDECINDSDCVEGLGCFDCTDDCTGNVSRCAPFEITAECTDGIF